MVSMADATPTEVIAALHLFGLARDRLRSATAALAGLAMADLDALEYLERFGPLTQRELGEKLLLTSGGVTVLVDRLERIGAVVRRPNPTDRRSALVYLVPDEELPEIPGLAEYHRELTAAAEAIPARQRPAVIAFLTTVTDRATVGAARMRERTPARSRTGRAADRG